MSNAIFILGFLFLGEPRELPCAEAADSNDDGRLNLGDAVGLLSYLFRGGPAPPEPFSACGMDPTPDDLGCSSGSVCP